MAVSQHCDVGEIDPAFRPVGKRVERADDVVAVNAQLLSHGGGAMSAMSFLFPKRPIDLGRHARELPADIILLASDLEVVADGKKFEELSFKRSRFDSIVVDAGGGDEAEAGRAGQLEHGAGVSERREDVVARIRAVLRRTPSAGAASMACCRRCSRRRRSCNQPLLAGSRL